MASDTSKDPGKIYIGKRNCSEYTVEINSPPGVFPNVDYDPDNPPTEPIDPPDTDGLEAGSSYAEVINGATVFYELGEDGEWTVVYVDEDLAGKCTTLVDLSDTETLDPANPPTAPFDPPADPGEGDTLIEYIDGALVFSTFNGTDWDVFTTCISEDPITEVNCVDGGKEYVSAKGNITCSNPTFVTRTINLSSTGFNSIVEGTVAGPVTEPGCTTLTPAKCFRRLKINTEVAVKQIAAGTGNVVWRPRISTDGGASFVNLVTGGQDEFWLDPDVQVVGEDHFTDTYTTANLPDDEVICMDVILQSESIGDGGELQFTTANAYVDYIEEACC